MTSARHCCFFFNFNSIQFYCKIGMTERSQWTEYKMDNQIYKQRTASLINSRGRTHTGCAINHKFLKDYTRICEAYASSE